MAGRQYRPFTKQIISRLAFLIVFYALILTTLPSLASALTVSPQTNTLSNPTEQTYQYVYAITNDGPAPRSLSLKLERYSEYLKDRVTFSKEQFALMPGATENVQVSFAPRGLGPETHTLDVGIYDGLDKVGSFSLVTVVPGTPIAHYALMVVAEDTTTRDLVPIEVTLSNLGNVVGYAHITLDILDGKGAVVGTVEYPDRAQVVPNDHSTFSLPFSEQLDPGFYTARISAVFPTQNLTAEKPFSVALGETKETIPVGSDLVLSFASLGNPPQITYSLVDATSTEVAAGSFTPQQGDLVVHTSELPAGAYALRLAMRGQTRVIAVTIKDKTASVRFVLAFIVGLIVLVAAWSVRRIAFLQLRILKLRIAVSRRERMVNNLINRAHRLVDEYAAHAARRNHGDTGSGTTDQGPR